MAGHRFVDRVLLVFALAGLGLAVTAIAITSRRPSEPIAYRIGDRVELPPETALQAPANLVIWISTKCEWCAKSMPIYERMARSHKRGRMIFVGIEPVAELAEFLRGSSVRPDGIMSLDQTAARRVPVTPTIMLVEPDGTIRSIWTGVVTPETEAQILNALQ